MYLARRQLQGLSVPWPSHVPELPVALVVVAACLAMIAENGETGLLKAEALILFATGSMMGLGSFRLAAVGATALQAFETW